jgi:cytochrome c-type biogenesis protein CcmH
MTEEDRSAFIRSMVERLASRLEDEPDDLEGWMRLANAYTVLGERDNAVSAYEKASALLQNAPETDPRRQRIERALSELKG